MKKTLNILGTISFISILSLNPGLVFSNPATLGDEINTTELNREYQPEKNITNQQNNNQVDISYENSDSQNNGALGVDENLDENNIPIPPMEIN